MSERKIIDLLPEIFQNNDQLRKFFNSTVDPLFQPEQKKKIAGLIGRIPSYFDPATDYYIVEPTSERQFYQLEPTMISELNNEVDLIQTYSDTINHLRFQGADTSNHSRLFDQQYYSWSPPIDIDKFLNFNNYYWYPEGPTAISITATVSNPIDVESDILGQISYISPNNVRFVNGMKVTFSDSNITTEYHNRTFIVEGVGRGIRLVDFDLLDPSVVPIETTNTNKQYITISRESRDENPWSRTNHWYHRNVLTFIDEDINNLIESDQAILWDADPWDIFPWDAIVTVLTPAFNLDVDRQARRPIIEFEEDLELYNSGIYGVRKVTYIEDSSTNVFADIHGQSVGSYLIDGIPLSVGDTILVTNDNNENVNNRIYDIAQVETSPGNFVYNLIINIDGIDSSGTPVLGEKILILQGNDQAKEYHFDGSNYILSQRKVSDNQAPLFKLFDTDKNYLGDTTLFPKTTFSGNEIFSYVIGDVDDIFDNELKFKVVYRNFQQASEIVFENDLRNQVYRYESEPLVFSNIKGFYYFYNYVSNTYNNGWYLNEEKSEQQINGNFYEIPLNLQGNPDYEEVETITRSELLDHFASIILNQNNILGSNFNQTNFRNTSRDFSKGNKIVHNEASMLKLMLLASNENYDYMLANRYVSREYRRFRNRIINKVESFINQGMDETLSDSVWLDDAIKIINISKKNTTLFPFVNNRTIPHGINYESIVYSQNGNEFELPNGHIFDVNNPGLSAVSVYLNNNLLLINYDYEINGDTVTLNSPITINDSLEIRFYENITKSFLPSTGAMMGLTKVYKPERFIDNTYVGPVRVIQCHDGSYHFEYGDKRDDIIFELEKRIYNNILEKFKRDKDIFFDFNEVKPGKFRNNDYTLEEYSNVLTPVFTTWAIHANINWTENTEDTTFDQGDWKTWNWTGVKDFNGNDLVGSWRAIYNYYYDTDRPNTHPWEMLGFSEKPDWWVSEYGSSYTSNNTKLWADLSQGLIRHGIRKGIDLLYIRNELQLYVPVDSSGNLKSPSEIGIAISDPNIVQAQQDWKAGDMGPAEVAFWRSSERSFFESQMAYLLKPAKWINLGWNTKTLGRSTADTTQVIDTDFDYRPQHQELIVDSETVNNDALIRTGIQQWISNRLQFLGINISQSIGNSLRGLRVQLGWRSAGFIYKQTLRFKADSFSPGSEAKEQQVIFIRDDDLEIQLYESDSIKEAFYGGVVVEWTGTGYQVVGYDTVYPYFKTVPSNKEGKFVTHTIGSTTVKEYKTSTYEVIQEVPYGFEFNTKQEVFDFIISYGRYLETEGWVFDEYDNTTNEILNWRYSGKEFLFWAEDLLEEGAFIALSPFANKVTLMAQHGQVKNVEEIIRGTYSILDRAGQVIRPEHTTVFRNDGLFQVMPENEQGIYAIRLSIKETENIILFRNITRFNDVIYIPLLNLRQSRLKVFGQVSDNWNGRLDAPGFLVDSNSDNNLISNYEKLADDIRYYFDIENPSENDNITDVARHLIGYQRKEYLDNLLIDRDTQYQFYQGLIKQKGSRNVLNRLFRSTAITTDKDVSFLEEWAIRVNQYGAVDSNKYFELRLLSSDIKNNPQIIRFTKGSKRDVKTDTIIDVLPNDEKWIISNNDKNEINKFSTREKNTRFKRDLPNAGYPQFNESTYLAVTPEDLIDINNNVFNASINETVWVALDNDNHLGRHSWDVLTLQEQENLFAFSDSSDLQIVNIFKKEDFIGNGTNDTFVVNNNIDLLEGAFVHVDGEETNAFTISGFNQITFNTAPTINSEIEVFYLTEHELEQKIFIFDSNFGRQAGIVESTNDHSITFKSIGELLSTISRGTIFAWETLRFANSNNLNNIAQQYPNNFIYIDQDESGWAVYKTRLSHLNLMRREEELVDIDLINNGLIYDEEKDKIITKLTVHDPFKGTIPGIADSNITYKLEIDPARYNQGPLVGESTERVWGENQIGRVWWDLSTVAFLYYEQGSLEYRYQNWGKIFPGTSVDIYEWVRSPVSPTQWNNYIQRSKDNFDFTQGGEIKNINSEDGPSWVEKVEKGKTVYYFWVKNKGAIPNNDFRSISIQDISDIIKNPLTEGIKTISIIDTNAFMVTNIENNLNDSGTILQFNYKNINTETPIHHQWELLRENDRFSFINDRHWNKMRDSLVGYDDLGKEVPDIRLQGNARFGHNIRPRQTWFKDRLLAREVFVEAVNDILLKINLVDTITNFDSHLILESELIVNNNIVEGTVANPVVNSGNQLSINGNIITFSGLNNIAGIADDINNSIIGNTLFAEIFYNGTDAFIRIVSDTGANINITDVSGTPSNSLGIATGLYLGEGPAETVDTREERKTLTGLTIGDRIFVESDEELNGYWSYWEYLGGDITVDSNWRIVQVQSYNTNLYWQFIDWYEEGFDNTVDFSIIVDNIIERNLLETTENMIIKVLNDGTGKWALYQFKGESWNLIGKEDATIELLDSLYVPFSNFGFEEELFELLPFDNFPQVEMRNIIDSLRKDIFIGQHEINQNIIFFKLVNHVHSENSIVDWIFKTSYLFIVGFTNDLSQKPLFVNDGFESLISYVNDVKPYHTKIKDIIRTFATVVDEGDFRVIDWDKPPFDDNRTVRILDETDENDFIFMQNNEPWSFWTQEYTKDLRPLVPRANNVRKIKTCLHFDRISSIRNDWVPAVTFENHPDYPDTFAPTPFYKTSVSSTEAKDIRTIKFLSNYKGTIEQLNSGVLFILPFNGDLNSQLVSGTMVEGSETYTDSIIPSLPDNQAFEFNGDRVFNLPNHTDINTQPATARSVSFVFRTETINDTEPQLIYGEGNDNSGFNITVFDNGNDRKIYATIYEDEGKIKDVISAGIHLKETYFVTFQFDTVASKAELLLNGNIVASSTTTVGASLDTRGQGTFGGISASNNHVSPVRDVHSNIIRYSEEFDQADWLLGNAVITPDNTTAPDGTMTADLITDDGGGGPAAVGIFQQKIINANDNHIFSVFAKAGTIDWILLSEAGYDQSNSTWFDLTNGVLGTTNHSDAGIDDYDNGWFRCWIQFNSSTDLDGFVNVFLADADNDSQLNTVDGTQTIFLWGAHLEPVNELSGYIQTTTSDVVVGYLDENNSKYFGILQYFIYYSESNITLENHQDIYFTLNNNIPEIFNIRKKPFNNSIQVISSGSFSGSTILIEADDDDSFADPITIATITSSGTININFNDIKFTPFLRVNKDSFTIGDNITLQASMFYENALSRALDYYSPTDGEPNLLEVIETYYLGTILDGFQLNLSGGWDASPWDFAGWDADTAFEDFLDRLIDGGSYFTYEGDNTTGTYNLPEIGNYPWYVVITDPSGSKTELIKDTDYSLTNTQIILVPGRPWMTSSSLTTGYLLSILDSSYLSLNDYETVYDGNMITQPDYEGWPEELVPLKVNDSALMTITEDNIQVQLLSGATSTDSSDSVYFKYTRPIEFTTSGIVGDTVLIEGSKTGSFNGEEVTIASLTSNTTITVPDIVNGYEVYPYYRARVSTYSSGLINVVAQLIKAPDMNYTTFEYSDDIGTGPYRVDNNISEISDLLVVLNDIFLEHTVDYTWTSNSDKSDTITFTSAQTDGDIVQIISWNTTESPDADPIWLSQAHSSATYDLAALGVNSGPTTPKENSMFVFGDDGTGWKRLAPPQARYYVGSILIGGGWDYDPWDYSPWDAEEILRDTFELIEDMFGIDPSDVTVWVNNIEQLLATDYDIESGGFTSPDMEIAAAGTGYSVNDILTVSGGTGDAAQFEVTSVGGSGEVESLDMVSNGFYTVLPSNPVSTSGGGGSGATLTLTNWAVILDRIIFNPSSIPDVGDRISIRILGKEDYTIDSNDIITITTSNITVGVDNIAFYSFRTNDEPLDIQTIVYCGRNGATIRPDDTKFELDTFVNSSDQIILTVAGNTDSGGITDRNFTLNIFDHVSQVELDTNYLTTDKIVITTIRDGGDNITGYFVGYEDTTEPFNEFNIDFNIFTTLSQTAQPESNSLQLIDARKFNPSGGIAWINGERIEYLQRTGGSDAAPAGTITGLVRGSKGTRKNKVHKVGDIIRSVTKETVFSIDKARLELNSFEVFVNNTIEVDLAVLKLAPKDVDID